jgi:hypothetical protein
VTDESVFNHDQTGESSVNSKLLQAAYLFLAVTGAIFVPYSLLIFVQAHGFDMSRMFADFLANEASTILLVDLGIASIVYHVWMIAEARRLRMRHWWIYIIWFWVIAFSSSMPLFLLMRERKLQEKSRVA